MVLQIISWEMSTGLTQCKAVHLVPIQVFLQSWSYLQSKKVRKVFLWLLVWLHFFSELKEGWRQRGTGAWKSIPCRNHTSQLSTIYIANATGWVVGVFSPSSQHFITKKNIHNSKLRRLESWLKRMNILFIKVHFIRKLPTCWTKARWGHRKKLCIYNQFPGSWKSEIFNKVVRKDCRHLCNRFTSGPQAFRKILDSRKTLAESTEKCHVLVLHL